MTEDSYCRPENQISTTIWVVGEFYFSRASVVSRVFQTCVTQQCYISSTVLLEWTHGRVKQYSAGYCFPRSLESKSIFWMYQRFCWLLSLLPLINWFFFCYPWLKDATVCRWKLWSVHLEINLSINIYNLCYKLNVYNENCIISILLYLKYLKLHNL